MATYTDNYSLIKPTMAELADIRTINGNMDIVDDILHGAQTSIAPSYDPNETYNDGDRCMYGYMLYECDYDNITGAWDASKWHRVYASETGGGGGQTYNDFTGATASTAGTHGLVPAPLAGDQDKFLKADGTWAEVSGGGSGSGGISYTTLYSGSTDVQTVNLTAPLSDFDLILIRGNSTGATPYVIENIYMADGLADTDVIGASDDSDFLWYTISNSLQTLTKATANNYVLAEVVGIKINSGGSNQKTYLVEGVGKNAGAVTAGGFKDIETGVYVDSADEEYIGYLMRYSGNPHLVISNVWIDNNLQINVTLFNPTGTSYSVDSATGIYFTVITGTSSGGGGLVDYSTDEQSTGQKWVDGRTIYQKTLEFTNLVIGSGIGFYHHIDDLREMVKLEIAGSMPTQTDYACGAIVGLQSAYISSGGFMTVNTNSSWDASSARTWYFTIYYTKED